eukprot:scaffold182334_cov61-Attheya_sp.AAC.1
MDISEDIDAEAESVLTSDTRCLSCYLFEDFIVLPEKTPLVLLIPIKDSTFCAKGKSAVISQPGAGIICMGGLVFFKLMATIFCTTLGMELFGGLMSEAQLLLAFNHRDGVSIDVTAGVDEESSDMHNAKATKYDGIGASISLLMNNKTNGVLTTFNTMCHNANRDSIRCKVGTDWAASILSIAKRAWGMGKLAASVDSYSLVWKYRIPPMLHKLESGPRIFGERNISRDNAPEMSGSRVKPYMDLLLLADVMKTIYHCVAKDVVASHIPPLLNQPYWHEICAMTKKQRSNLEASKLLILNMTPIDEGDAEGAGTVVLQKQVS